MGVDRRGFLGLSAAAGAGALGVARNRPTRVPMDVSDATDQGSGVLRYELSAAPSSARTTQAQSQQASALVESNTFELVGVTWDRGEAAPEVDLRVRTASGWTSWSALGSGHEPDDGARPGTDPLWVGRADAVEVRATAGALPAGLSLDLVQPSAAPAGSPTDVAVTQSVTTSAAIASTRPTIYTRASWGADETLRQNQDNVWYGEVRGMFVHHTATSNDYTSAEVPAILRSIYRYHVLSRNFMDIGYNFLVDRFGRIWEGAYGGVDRAVVGAHTQYYNSHSFAMSAIGSFQLIQPPASVVTAYQNLIAWKFAVHGVRSATATANYTNSGARPLPVISGHRDTKSTTCPGGNLYARLGAIRSRVSELLRLPSVLRMTGPGLANRGERVSLDVSWTLNGTPLSGAVNLQRRSGGRWQHVRQIRVNAGQATTVITPGATNSYRLRISSVDQAGVDTRDPQGTSNTQTVHVLQAGGPALVTLDGPPSVARAAQTTLDIRWTHGGSPVSGRVNLQRQTPAGAWQHVRQIIVDRGQASTVITPGASNRYRIRASSASAPAGTPTADPLGTSNVLSVSVP